MIVALVLLLVLAIGFALAIPLAAHGGEREAPCKRNATLEVREVGTGERVLGPEHLANGPLIVVTRNVMVDEGVSRDLGPPQVGLQLTKPGARRLAWATARLARQREQLAILVDDRIVSTLTVTECLTRGSLMITMATVDDAIALAKLLACVPVSASSR